MKYTNAPKSGAIIIENRKEGEMVLDNQLSLGDN